MGQILTLDTIISIIEIKSSPDIEIHPSHDSKDQEYFNHIQNYQDYYTQEYIVDCILNVELIEEPVSTKLITLEDEYGIILDVV